MPNILLVEDNAADVLLVRECLDTYSRTIALDVVGDGAEAMDFLTQSGAHSQSPRPDLVLLDLNLPRLDGRSVLKSVRSNPAISDIPVIVFSSSASQLDINTCYALNANGYVVKPIKLEHYEAALESTLNFWCATARLPMH